MKGLAPLTLGTVQFGLNYGISNPRNDLVPFQEVEKILLRAQELNISFLDTANPYGMSEEVIGKFHLKYKKYFPIISKLQASTAADANNIFRQGLQKLNIDKYHGYLIHRFEQYMENQEIFTVLLENKKQGYVDKVGFSLYYPEELDYLLNHGVPIDIVQIPFSIFDQRFSKYLPILQKKNIEVHVRSVFLQGLLFKTVSKLDSFFEPIKQKIRTVQKLAQKENIPIHALCLNYARLTIGINYVVIGVHTAEQFELNYYSEQYIDKVKAIYTELSKFSDKNDSMIIPTFWPSKI